MDDIEAQRDELLALASILDENQILVDSSSCQTAGCIYVKPEILQSLTIQITESSASTEATKFELQHLCPIELHFSVPPSYPSSSPPQFTLVCKWLKREQVI